MNILMVSLGCDKNLCDSETMLGILAERHMNIVNDEHEADVVIVNTCSFIKDAMEESINTLIEMGQLKQENLKYLIACGCLAERYKDELLAEIPEVDAVVGTTAFDKIADVIESLIAKDQKKEFFEPVDRLATSDARRIITSGTFMGYLKIAEGCSKRCTYCIIPKLRGNYRSVPMEKLLAEAENMASQGIKELILVAQETTCYGLDLYGEKRLPELIRKIAEIDGIEWIRLLYAYPEEITDELIETFRDEKKLLPYIDMPIQHCSDAVLKRMGRRTNKASIKEVIGKLRSVRPEIAIRTSLIAGFPGETDADHEELMEFLDEMELTHVGTFTYSREEGTPAFDMVDQVPEEVAERYRDEIMELCMEISTDRNEALIGQTMSVIVEGYSPDEDVYVGRTYMDAPGVDGLCFFTSPYEPISGSIVDVLIEKAGPYDLVGSIVQ